MTNPTHAPADMLDAKGLLPCPFCGGPAELDNAAEPQFARRPTVTCSNEDCFGYMPSAYFARDVDAIAAWNRRASLPAGNEPVARIAFSDVALLGDIFDFLGGVDGAASLRDRILAVMSPSVASPLTPEEGETWNEAIEASEQVEGACLRIGLVVAQLPSTSPTSVVLREAVETIRRYASRPTPTSGETGHD